MGCSAGMRGLYETTVCKAHAAALKSGERDIYNSVENMIYRYRTPRLRTSVEGTGPTPLLMVQWLPTRTDMITGSAIGASWAPC